jgi:hypothetical protein
MTLSSFIAVSSRTLDAAAGASVMTEGVAGAIAGATAMMSAEPSDMVIIEEDEVIDEVFIMMVAVLSEVEVSASGVTTASFAVAEDEVVDNVSVLMGAVLCKVEASLAVPEDEVVDAVSITMGVALSDAEISVSRAMTDSLSLSSPSSSPDCCSAIASLLMDQ